MSGNGCNPCYPHCTPPPDLNWVMQQLRCQMDRLNMLQNSVDVLVLNDNANTIRMTEIEQSLSQLTLTVGNALNDIATLKGDVIVLKQDVIVIKSRVMALEAAVEALETDLAALTQRVNDNDAHDAQQDEEIIALKVRMTNAENAAANLSASVTALTIRVGALETDVTNLQIDNTANKQNIANLNGRMTGAELDIDILQTAYENLSPRVAAVEIVAQNAMNGVNGLAPRVGALETSQAQQDAKIANIEQVNVQQGNALVIAAQDIDALELGQHVQDDRLDALEASDASQDNTITGLTVRVTNVENRVTVIEDNSASVANLNTRVTNLETETADHETRIVALEAGGGGGGDLEPRVIALETSQGVQDGRLDMHDTSIYDEALPRITALENDLSTVLYTSLPALDTKNAQQDSRISSAESVNQTQNDRLNELERQIFNETNFFSLDTEIQLVTRHVTTSGGEIMFGFGNFEGQSGVFCRIFGGGDLVNRVVWRGSDGWSGEAVVDKGLGLDWYFLHDLEGFIPYDIRSADYAVFTSSRSFSGYAGRMTYISAPDDPRRRGISSRV